ncbi:MAG: ATP-binding cassette domain-containing protein [Candidatus Nanopelagicales bacterium]|nr:ATP-binding cassette domain-containing protein [Candidatus Nanopelagicales bacterium]MDZ4248733.1 ATP-binding cassette domain-containing protein [Candidatus Nanopelagicales bacterium]
MSDVAPMISLRDVSVARHGSLIWSEGSFDVPQGSVVAVIGPNGSGKTTLLHLLLGLLPPASGSVEVLGTRPRKGDRRVGYVPQHYGTASGEFLLARDQVMMGLTGYQWGLRRATQRQLDDVDAALADAGAAESGDRRVADLSGGQQQRVAIARALVGDPELLVLDEPFASLDLRNQNELVSVLGRVHDQRGIGILIVTHDLNPLLSLINSVIYLFDGHAHYASLDEAVSEELLTHLYGTKIRVVRTAQGDLFTRSG